MTSVFIELFAVAASLVAGGLVGLFTYDSIHWVFGSSNHNPPVSDEEALRRRFAAKSSTEPVYITRPRTRPDSPEHIIEIKQE